MSEQNDSIQDLFQQFLATTHRTPIFSTCRKRWMSLLGIPRSNFLHESRTTPLLRLRRTCQQPSISRHNEIQRTLRPISPSAVTPRARTTRSEPASSGNAARGYSLTRAYKRRAADCPRIHRQPRFCARAERRFGEPMNRRNRRCSSVTLPNHSSGANPSVASSFGVVSGMMPRFPG